MEAKVLYVEDLPAEERIQIEAADDLMRKTISDYVAHMERMIAKCDGPLDSSQVMLSIGLMGAIEQLVCNYMSAVHVIALSHSSGAKEAINTIKVGMTRLQEGVEDAVAASAKHVSSLNLISDDQALVLLDELYELTKKGKVQ